MEAQYFLAYSEYQLENYASAIELTRGMLQNTSVNIETRQKTEWLHIQSLLVNDQINSIDFKQLLSQLIIDEDHIFHSKAVALEKRLNSFWRKLIF